MLISNSAETVTAPLKLEVKSPSSQATKPNDILTSNTLDPCLSSPSNSFSRRDLVLLLSHSQLPAAFCWDDICRMGRRTQTGQGNTGRHLPPLPLWPGAPRDAAQTHHKATSHWRDWKSNPHPDEAEWPSLPNLIPNCPILTRPERAKRSCSRHLRPPVCSQSNAATLPSALLHPGKHIKGLCCVCLFS